jgi:hypothetical protein
MARLSLKIAVAVLVAFCPLISQWASSCQGQMRQVVPVQPGPVVPVAPVQPMRIVPDIPNYPPPAVAPLPTFGEGQYIIPPAVAPPVQSTAEEQ